MATQRKAMKKNIQKLIDERDKLRFELASMTATYQGRIGGIEMAIALLQKDDDDSPDGDPTQTGRGEAKALLLDLLREVGTTGLNATTAEEIAKRRGVTLKRATAASNLSRLKKDGVVVHDGERYRLPEFARPVTLAVIPGMAS